MPGSQAPAEMVRYQLPFCLTSGKGPSYVPAFCNLELAFLRLLCKPLAMSLNNRQRNIQKRKAENKNLPYKPLHWELVRKALRLPLMKYSKKAGKLWRPTGAVIVHTPSVVTSFSFPRESPSVIPSEKKRKSLILGTTWLFWPRAPGYSSSSSNTIVSAFRETTPYCLSYLHRFSSKHCSVMIFEIYVNSSQAREW